MRDKINSPWYKYLILVCVGIVFICVYLWHISGWTNVYQYAQAFWLGGYVLVLLGGLSFVTSQGIFDMFTFLPTRLSKSQRHDSYAEYCNKKAVIRYKRGWVFAPYFMVGVCYLAVGGIIYIFSI